MFSNAAVFVVSVVLMDSFGKGTYLPCPSGWVSYEGSPSCYNVPAQPTNSWYVARKNCLSMGGDLATISSQKENNYVGILLNTYFPAPAFGWIGFIADSKRRFTWVDGSSLAASHFKNWHSGEPSSINEECGSMVVTKRAMTWNDLSCLWTHKIGYVCEKERDVAVRGC